MSIAPIMAAQSNNPLQITHQQNVTMELARFLRINKLLDFTYDSSKTTSGSTISVFSKTIKFLKTINTIDIEIEREVEGEISKKADGTATFKLTIDEKTIKTRQDFENDVFNIYVGLKNKDSRQIVSRTQIQRMPSGKWGANIILDLDKTGGSYELVVGKPAQPPAPSTPSKP